MEVKELEALVKERLSKKRCRHVFNVRDSALLLARCHKGNTARVEVAALLHDITKEEPRDKQLQTIVKSGIILNTIVANSPQLYHAVTGSLYAQSVLGIQDGEVLDAIRYHTTGRAGMSRTEKIVYLADAISADRSYKGVELFRRLALQSLDAAMLAVLQHTLRYLVKDGALVPEETLDAYNQYVLQGKNASAF